MLDAAANFVNVQASTGYLSGATSITLQSGQGASLPAAPFNLIWWNSTDYPNPANDPNVEIIRVTVIAGDTLTISRAQEGTAATNKNTAGKTSSLVLGITAKMIADIAAQTGNGIPVYNEIVSGSGTTFTLANTPVANSVRLYAAGGNLNPQEGRLLPGIGNDFTVSGATITMLNGSFALGTISGRLLLLTRSTQDADVADNKKILEEFWHVCLDVRSDYDAYRSLFEDDHGALLLYGSTAPIIFGQLNKILVANLVLQFCKITDISKMGKNANLTTNYIVSEMPWPDDVRDALIAANARLMEFRRLIEPARSKRIAHTDLKAQVEQHENLGAFTKGRDAQFLLDLQSFLDIAFGHLFAGEVRPISIGGSMDTYKLTRAIEKSVLFDRCYKCEQKDRNIDLLDFEDRMRR